MLKENGRLVFWRVLVNSIKCIDVPVVSGDLMPLPTEVGQVDHLPEVQVRDIPVTIEAILEQFPAGVIAIQIFVYVQNSTGPIFEIVWQK